MISKDNISRPLGSVAFAILAIALLMNSVSAISLDQMAIKDVAEEPSNLRGAKLIGVPNSLVRFLFYNARPLEHTSGSLLGYKRSSSALDALTGVTLGKRSQDYLNLEPFYNRQYGMRSVPRMYDVRWAPLDTYNAPVAQEMS